MPDLEVVSYSEVDTYRQCRLKHQLSYIERWRMDEDQEALARGTLFHSVMEAHYREIQRRREQEGFGSVDSADHIAEDLFIAVAPLLYEEGTGAQSERQELVEWMYRGYVEHFQTDEEWEIVGIEVPFMEPLLRFDGSESDYLLAGTVDLIVKKKISDGLWIVDHKTCKNLPKQKDFDMEDQTGIYAYLLRRAGHDVRGAIYNHCRTWKLQRAMEMDERFKRQLTVRTEPELETMAREAMELMHEAYSNHDARTAERGVYDAPRSPDGERCGWKCGYTEACLAGRKLGPQRTREFLEDIGYTQHETKPGPTFNRKVKAEAKT